VGAQMNSDIEFRCKPELWIRLSVSLMPSPDDESRLVNFQPVPREPDGEWTDYPSTWIEWFRSSKKTIS
jgi:hypothetical protein